MQGTFSLSKISDQNFPVIYNNYYSLLVKYAYVIIKDKEEAKDIVADVFVELWHKRHRLTIHTGYRSYLLVCVRRAAQKKTDKNRTVFTVASNEVADVDNPFSKIISKENLTFLDELFKQLPGIKYEIVQLRLLGLSYSEIAEVLNITIKKVEYHLNQSINILQEKIKYNNYYKELSVALSLLSCLNEVTIW